MKTSNQVEYTYFIEDMVGEGSHTEFFFDWLSECVGREYEFGFSNRLIQQEFIDGFKNSKLGEVDCRDYGAYGDINFTFLLTQQQEDDMKGFKNSLDIITKHFITKYRLRGLFKFYQMYQNGTTRGSRVATYLARRKMRTINGWIPLLK